MTWGAVGAAAIGVGGASLLGGGGGGATAEQPKYVTRAGKDFSRGLATAIDQYDPQFYQGQMFADQSPYSQQAIQGMGQFSSQPSQDYLSSVMGGDYLGLNPQMQNAVMNPAMQAVNDQFNAAGRYGSAMNQQQASQAGMSALMPYYNAERQRQQQAAQLLPEMQAGDLELQARGGAGAERYAQQPITQAMQRHEFEQNQPLMASQQYGNMIAPLFGTPNQSQSSPGWANNLSGLLGGMGSYYQGAGNYLQNSTAGANMAPQGAAQGVPATGGYSPTTAGGWW